MTIAAVRDDAPTVQALLAVGASAKLITSIYDGTAPIAAAHLNRDGVVCELIRAGADARISDRNRFWLCKNADGSLVEEILCRAALRSPNISWCRRTELYKQFVEIGPI